MSGTFEKTKRRQIPSDFEYGIPFPEQVKTTSRADFISWYTELYRLKWINQILMFFLTLL